MDGAVLPSRVGGIQFYCRTTTMAASLSIAQRRKAATVFRTVVRCASSHTALKSQYDAVVIGGGEMCCRNYWKNVRGRMVLTGLCLTYDYAYRSLSAALSLQGS